MSIKALPVALAACATLAIATVFATGQSGQAKAGAQAPKAPDFSAKANDGKTYTLKSLTEKGDFFLYFIKDDCPVNDQAVAYFNRLGTAYKDKAAILGVYDGSESQFRAWQARYKPTYPVLFDPDMKIIKSYKAQASPWMIHVSKAGSITKVWPGYSADFINQMSASMAGAAKTAVARIDTAGAPRDTRYG